MYHELIYHLDLCILSYHLYSQTLVWPMDPYYEQMARKGTSRRTNFINGVRTNNAQQAFPAHLDPILADYSRIDPRRPCFVKPIDDWLVYQAPTQITDPIRKTFLMDRNKQVTEIPYQIASPQQNPTTDDVYCFEGVTGAIKGKPGERSIMGFVLARNVQNNADYDIHIVFRGSRSGSAGRAATQGLFSEHGNPDWVTDTDARPLVVEPEISQVGRCSRGFATSMKEIMPMVFVCLSNIAQNKNRIPRQIYVTGHSLGGALAAHFASAVIMGNRNPMPENIKAWPWPTLKLITFSAPTVGDEVFRSAFNNKVPVRRVMMGQDLVTQERINYHVGARVKIPGKALPNFDDHEPYRIRRKLLSMVRTTWGEANQLDTTPANTGAEQPADPDEPWKICTSFADVLSHPKFDRTARQNVAASLEPFKNHLIRYLNTLEVVQGMDSSYKKNILTKAADKAAKQTAIRNLVSGVEKDMWENTTNWWLNEQTRNVLDADTYNFLGLCIVLNRLTHEPSFADNLPAPLQTCISNI